MTASIHQLPLKSRRFAAKAAALPNATAGVAPTLELGRLSRRVQFGIAGWRPKHATRQAPGPDARRRRDQTPERAAHRWWVTSPVMQRCVLVLATLAALLASPLDAAAAACSTALTQAQPVHPHRRSYIGTDQA